MYYTACLLLTIQWQLLCQAIVSLVYKWEGLLKIVWGGGLQPPEPPLDPPMLPITDMYLLLTLAVPITNYRIIQSRDCSDRILLESVMDLQHTIYQRSLGQKEVNRKEWPVGMAKKAHVTTQIQSQPECGMPVYIHRCDCWTLPRWEGLGGMGCEWLVSTVCRGSYTWTIQMGGVGRSGAGLRMVSRVSVIGAGRSGAGLQTIALQG